VARGTQHRKRRPTANARAAAVAAQKPRKQKPPQWQEELFFARLRVHAKWAFVLLAAVFALGFVFFGVGSGSTGISDALQNAFSFGNKGGTSISKLQAKADKHPQDPKAWRDLATALEQKQKTSDAVDALKRYTALRPKDQSALEELAGLYSRRADDFRTEAQLAQAQSQAIAPGSVFQPPSSSPLGRAYQDPTALQDPVGNAVTQQANAKASDAYSKLSSVEKEAVAVYKRLIALNPNDATRQIQLGEAAQNAGDTPTAIAAYKRFLKLSPDDPLAAQVKARLKQLSPPAKSASG
jgi:cytochrome c-type biogenesis protein CcmH/NrfG